MIEHETREDLEAYALGALDDAERRRVSRHLAGCASCRSAVAEYDSMLAELPAALAATSTMVPDPTVLRRVLAVATRQPPWSRLAGFALGAAVVLLILAGALNLQLNQTLAQEREIFRRLAGQQEIVFEVVDSPRSTKTFLRSPVSGSSAYGKVFVRSDLPFVVAMAGNLPPPPEGQRYHLWLTLDAGETILAGILTQQDGFGSLVYQADRNGPTFQSVRLIAQPPGATAPEGVPVIFWSR
ncbi:MAG: anti-sigma factor [Chloroflexi bacterium]|nr:anti-sigma factor [Chloroflexota bacterium]